MRRGTDGFTNTEFMSLSEFQQRIATLVFSLAEAEGFALAGGGALIAHEVVDRTTRDLDCFGPTRAAVDRLWPAIRDRLLNEGLVVDVQQIETEILRGCERLERAPGEAGAQRMHVDEVPRSGSAEQGKELVASQVVQSPH